MLVCLCRAKSCSPRWQLFLMTPTFQRIYNCILFARVNVLMVRIINTNDVDIWLSREESSLAWESRWIGVVTTVEGYLEKTYNYMYIQYWYSHPFEHRESSPAGITSSQSRGRQFILCVGQTKMNPSTILLLLLFLGSRVLCWVASAKRAIDLAQVGWEEREPGLGKIFSSDATASVGVKGGRQRALISVWDSDGLWRR